MAAKILEKRAASRQGGVESKVSFTTKQYFLCFKMNNGEGNYSQSMKAEKLDEATIVADDKERSVDITSSANKIKRDDGIQYESKKPKWWRGLCQKPSKAQKKARAEILEDLRLPRIPYGSFIRWSEVFPKSANDNIWLELGFGRGENFLALAHRKMASISIVGAEIHQGKLFYVMRSFA